MIYPFTIYKAKVEDEIFWAAEIPLLRGCVAQGETQEQALEALQLAEEEWLETARKYGFDVPEVPLENLEVYSGKFTVRMASHVHKTAVELAKKQGVSLNQYVNDAITMQNGMIMGSSQVMPYIEKSLTQLEWMIAGVRSETKKLTNAGIVDGFDGDDGLYVSYPIPVKKKGRRSLNYVEAFEN